MKKAIDINDLGKVVETKQIAIEFYNGEIMPVRLSNSMLNDYREKLISYDFCYMILSRKPKQKIQSIKIGDFKKANDGDEVYTCGYPLAVKEQFISRGYISTKYIDSSLSFTSGNIKKRVYRHVATMDITLNKGNSGGPVIKIGKTPDEDEVIGISSFIISSALDIDRVILALKETKEIPMPTNEPNKQTNLIAVLDLISSSLYNSSNGIGGAISINHFMDLINSK